MFRIIICTIALLAFVGARTAAKSGPKVPACCRCTDDGPGASVEEVVCLHADQMRSHVTRIEPLPMPRYGNKVNISGVVEMHVRFAADGTVACARAISGNPMAIACALEAVPKWQFKPVEGGRNPRGGCGKLRIRYKLSDAERSTEVE